MKNRLAFLHVVNTIHFIDEYYFNFPEWATEHFGTTSKSYYLVSHALILALMLFLFVFLIKDKKNAVFYMLTAQVIFFTNGLFHIVTTFLWAEYSPGLLSQLVILPMSLYIFYILKRMDTLSWSTYRLAFIEGSCISILIISSLFLHI